MTSGKTGARIIVIDDDDLVNEIIRAVLEDHYDVTSYFSAEDALKSPDVFTVDAIITDIHLPGISGIEFLEKVRGTDPAASVIVITGYNDIDLAVSAMKKGACDFILKPFKNDQIVLAAERAVMKKSLLLENIKLVEELREKNRDLEALNKKIHDRNLEMENELDIARNLQQCLFPVSLPEIQGIDFSLRFMSLERISGDFFEFIQFDEDCFGFVFADVSGHGVPAALYAAMLKTAIDTHVGRDVAPDKTVSGMNAFLIGAQKKMSYNYATVFYGLFDLGTGKLTYCNAGIPAPAVLRKNGEIHLLEPNGPFVGIFNTSEYVSESIDVERGDKIIFYTDGAFECVNFDEVLYGQSGFLKIIESLRGENIAGIVNGAYRTVEEFCGPGGFSDDVMILGMHRD